MITRLRAENFKSWEDTGELRLGRLTGLFGTNSSGKTSILQLLPLLKQTVDFPDRNRVLYTGNEDSPVYLGTFLDSVHRRRGGAALKWYVAWLNQGSLLNEPSPLYDSLYHPKEISFRVSMLSQEEGPAVDLMEYDLAPRWSTNLPIQDDAQEFIDALQEPYRVRIGMHRSSNGESGYELTHEGRELDGVLIPEAQRVSAKLRVSPPVKCYGFPPDASRYFEDPSILSALELAFVNLFGKVHYLGPLRPHPRNSYPYGGEKPLDAGWDGEETIQALVASGTEPLVAQWLRDMELIHSFRLEPLDPRHTIYQCWVKTTATATEVLLPGVGFGVSQILPVLVDCAMLDDNSTLLLEQPEIHLHPSAQAALADVLIDAIKDRNIQIIVESHSEHLLKRIQRRIAEEQFSPEDAALYFCHLENGVSRIEELELDPYGYIRNWPKNFFGDEMEEVTSMTVATARRQKAGRK